jgi:hypothetical protein
MTKEDIADTSDDKDFVDNTQVAENEDNGMDIAKDEEDEYEEDETNSHVYNELCKYSKFRICLCQRLKNGELQYISNFVDTDLIKECKLIVVYEY